MKIRGPIGSCEVSKGDGRSTRRPVAAPATGAFSAPTPPSSTRHERWPTPVVEETRHCPVEEDETSGVEGPLSDEAKMPNSSVEHVWGLSHLCKTLGSRDCLRRSMCGIFTDQLGWLTWGQCRQTFHAWVSGIHTFRHLGIQFY